MLHCQSCDENEARYVNRDGRVTCGLCALPDGVRISDVPVLERIIVERACEICDVDSRARNRLRIAAEQLLMAHPPQADEMSPTMQEMIDVEVAKLR
jgi:hypothetical protein